MLLKKFTGRWSPVVLFALLVLALLTIVAFATRCYAAVTAQQSSNYAQRGTLSYLSTRVRSADIMDSVQVRPTPQGDCLVLIESSGSAVYETRIYYFDGNLVEEYAAADSALRPEQAQVLGPAERFTAQLADGLLTLTTERGSVCVALRAGGAV